MSWRFWKGCRPPSPDFTMRQSLEVLRRLCAECLGRSVGDSELVAETTREVAEKMEWRV